MALNTLPSSILRKFSSTQTELYQTITYQIPASWFFLHSDLWNLSLCLFLWLQLLQILTISGTSIYNILPLIKSIWIVAVPLYLAWWPQHLSMCPNSLPIVGHFYVPLHQHTAFFFVNSVASLFRLLAKMLLWVLSCLLFKRQERRWPCRAELMFVPCHSPFIGLTSETIRYFQLLEDSLCSRNWAWCYRYNTKTGRFS